MNLLLSIGSIFTSLVLNVYAGNVRLYYLVSGVKTYVSSTQGTIDYATGQITLNSLNVASISNIRGAASTKIELTVVPNSNDIVPVRAQIVEIDASLQHFSPYTVRRQSVVPSGRSSRMMPFSARASRILSASAKSLA